MGSAASGRRKPVEALQREGTYRPDRHNKRGDEPTPPGDIEETRFTDVWAQWCWDKMYPMALELSQGDVDTVGLTTACELFGEYKSAMARCQELDIASTDYTRVFRIARAAFASFLDIARPYGLTPQDRIKLAKPIQEAKEVDELAALVDEAA